MRPMFRQIVSELARPTPHHEFRHGKLSVPGYSFDASDASGVNKIYLSGGILQDLQNLTAQ